MSDNDKAFGFGAFVPGFDFLQGLVKSAASNAGGGMPQGAPDWSKWVAPTLQADEIEKRIGELKTVQFWLEQNARALAATIQALEVQKMTLATLRGMNLQVNDMAQAFSFARPGAAGAPAASAPAAPRASGSGAYDDMYTQRPAEPMPAAHAEPPPDAAAATPAPPPAGPGAAPAVDPLQWWGALAGQFQQIAAGAMQEAAEQARLSPAIDLQDAARKAFEAAGRMGAEVAAAAASTASVAPVAAAAPAKKRAAPRKAAASAPVAPTARPVARKAAARKKTAKPAPRRAGR